MGKRGPSSIHASQIPARTAMAIGDRLKYVRLAIGLTQAEFAKSIGSSQGACGQYEAGMRRPAIEIGLRILDRHGVSLDFLYAGNIAKLDYEFAEKLRKAGFRP